MPIHCSVCKKYAKLHTTFINGLDQIKLAGSCKHCGYDDPTDYPKGTSWEAIPISKIDYDDFNELGIEDR